MTSARNRMQLHRTLDALTEDGVIRGWGQDRHTSTYIVALPGKDARFFCPPATCGR